VTGNDENKAMDCCIDPELLATLKGAFYAERAEIEKMTSGRGKIPTRSAGAKRAVESFASLPSVPAELRGNAGQGEQSGMVFVNAGAMALHLKQWCYTTRRSHSRHPPTAFDVLLSDGSEWRRVCCRFGPANPKEGRAFEGFEDSQPTGSVCPSACTEQSSNCAVCSSTRVLVNGSSTSLSWGLRSSRAVRSSRIVWETNVAACSLCVSIAAHLPRPSVLRRPRRVACGNGGMAPPDDLPLQPGQRGARQPGQLEFAPILPPFC
jgi:hypothetical protein